MARRTKQRDGLPPVQADAPPALTNILIAVNSAVGSDVAVLESGSALLHMQNGLASDDEAISLKHGYIL